MCLWCRPVPAAVPAVCGDGSEPVRHRRGCGAGLLPGVHAGAAERAAPVGRVRTVGLRARHLGARCAFMWPYEANSRLLEVGLAHSNLQLCQQATGRRSAPCVCLCPSSRYSCQYLQPCSWQNHHLRYARQVWRATTGRAAVRTSTSCTAWCRSHARCGSACGRSTRPRCRPTPRRGRARTAQLCHQHDMCDCWGT